MSHCLHCASALEDGLRFCGQCGSPVAKGEVAQASGPPDPWIGRVIDGRYQVIGRLGAGGMGVVYRVEHLHLGKTAAMKVLSPDTAERPEMVRRFRQEAQAVSKLDHPNIVQTFDFGQSSDGALYLVMEYIKGDDLATLLRRQGPWSFERAARLFIQVCSGLSDAHEAGIVHRDLKPENLMVVQRRDGTEHAKVLDFGLAKLRERSDAGAVSSSGQVLGTPYYMAPEQVRGESLDARADIYSLGATLYRVLTGQPPFDAPSPMSVLAKHLTDEVVSPRSRVPSLPPEADGIVLRAMEKTRENRYASAADVQADLERALGASGATSLSGSTSSLRAPAVAARVPVGEAPTLALEESDPAVGVERLRRADVDDYEWSLRRQRLLRRLVLPALVVVAAAVGGALVWRGGSVTRADAAEREPNNTPGYANPLTSGAAMRGTVGTPISAREGDVDYFRIPAGRGPRTVQARLEAIPGIDLVLELFDGQGRRLVKSDARGRGIGEWLQPIAIGPTEAYLAVREVWIEGTTPTANSADAYTLTARWGAPQPGWEIEPNDWPAAASALSASGRVRGYLGSAEDRDWFSIVPARPGKLSGSLETPAGVDAVVYLDEAGKRTVDRHGAGEPEAFSVDVEPGKPVLIGVGRKLEAKPEPKKESRTAAGKKGREEDPKDLALEGLDDPYELVVKAP